MREQSNKLDLSQEITLSYVQQVIITEDIITWDDKSRIYLQCVCVYNSISTLPHLAIDCVRL